jgi:TnpA family transposase
VMFYTHIPDQYAPYYIQLISATMRDATHVIDGLLYHQTDLPIEEHYTDTAGYTNRVFALCHLLGFRFRTRIRDLADKNLYAIRSSSTCTHVLVLMSPTLVALHEPAITFGCVRILH